MLFQYLSPKFFIRHFFIEPVEFGCFYTTDQWELCNDFISPTMPITSYFYTLHLFHAVATTTF